MSLDDFNGSRGGSGPVISEGFSPIMDGDTLQAFTDSVNFNDPKESAIIDPVTMKRMEDAGISAEDIILSVSTAIGIDNLEDKTNQMLAFTTSYNILNWYKSSPHVTGDQFARVVNGVSRALHEGLKEENQSPTTAIDWSSDEALDLTRQAITDGALGEQVMNDPDNPFYHDAHFATAMTGVLCKWSEESNVNMGRNRVICENLQDVVTSMRYFDRPFFHAYTRNAENDDQGSFDP